MIYTKFNIRLTLLKEEDIEQVRLWRNDTLVVNNYEFREYITPEMQKKWFDSIRNIHNTYFVIEYKGRKVGVINAKNINWEQQSLESGIFIPDPEVYQTQVPAIVSLMMTDLLFKVFDWKTISAHVMRHNLSVIRYNKSLGYELCDGQDGVENQLYRLSRENFTKKAARILKAVSVISGENDTQSTILIEPSDKTAPFAVAVESFIQKSKLILKKEEDSRGRSYYFG